MDYALIKDGVVVNKIVLLGGSKYRHPEDCDLVKADAFVDIGDSYVDGKFVPKPQPEREVVPVKSLVDQILEQPDFAKLKEALK